MISSRFETMARVLPPRDAPGAAEILPQKISALYAASQKSKHVFGSPLGPFHFRGREFELPRFVYFGPQTHDASLRLAFFAGFDARDLRPALALAEFIERLAADPPIAQGLNLSIFPIVDILGLSTPGESRGLARAHWGRTSAPELNGLEKDARARGYHGFIRLETHAAENIAVTLRTSSDDAEVELVSASDFAPDAVGLTRAPAHEPAREGPLAILEDLPVRAFDLCIAFPDTLPEAKFYAAVPAALERLCRRHSALQSYGQHL